MAEGRTHTLPHPHPLSFIIIHKHILHKKRSNQRTTQKVKTLKVVIYLLVSENVTKLFVFTFIRLNNGSYFQTQTHS